MVSAAFKSVALIAAVGLGVWACEKQAPTLGYMNSVGHEMLHCYFGEWHPNTTGEHNLTVYPALNFSDKITDVSTISLYFLPDDEVQAKYRELQALDRKDGGRRAVPDDAAAGVHAFNVRYLNSHACDIYIARIQ